MGVISGERPHCSAHKTVVYADSPHLSVLDIIVIVSGEIQFTRLCFFKFDLKNKMK